jgi:hypothetical protein
MRQGLVTPPRTVTRAHNPTGPRLNRVPYYETSALCSIRLLLGSFLAGTADSELRCTASSSTTAGALVSPGCWAAPAADPSEDAPDD